MNFSIKDIIEENVEQGRDNANAVSIDGVSVNASSPNDGDKLIYDDAGKEWVSQAPSGGSFSVTSVFELYTAGIDDPNYYSIDLGNGFGNTDDFYFDSTFIDMGNFVIANGNIAMNTLTDSAQAEFNLILESGFFTTNGIPIPEGGTIFGTVSNTNNDFQNNLSHIPGTGYILPGVVGAGASDINFQLKTSSDSDTGAPNIFSFSLTYVIN